MHERGQQMRLDWKPAIRGLDVIAPSHAAHFIGKALLLITITHVFDHGIAEHDIERSIGEGHFTAAGEHQIESNAASGAVRHVEKRDARFYGEQLPDGRRASYIEHSSFRSDVELVGERAHSPSAKPAQQARDQR